MTGSGVDALVGRLTTLVDEARRTVFETGETGFVVHRPVVEDVQVERTGTHTWRVAGRSPERAVALVNRTAPDAIAYLWDRLRGLGVDRALARAGVEDGDSVEIGDFAYDYVADG